MYTVSQYLFVLNTCKAIVCCPLLNMQVTDHILAFIGEHSSNVHHDSILKLGQWYTIANTTFLSNQTI